MALQFWRAIRVFGESIKVAGVEDTGVCSHWGQ